MFDCRSLIADVRRAQRRLRAHLSSRGSLGPPAAEGIYSAQPTRVAMRTRLETRFLGRPRNDRNSLPTAPCPLPPAHIPHGITLLEVLISMFVLLFGLMGVAAIFPVGSHYVVEGEKWDQGSRLAQNAFEEIKARGMLRPEVWLYPDPNAPDPRFIDPSTNRFTYPFPRDGGDRGPGLSFVIDPLGAANELSNVGDIFPNGKLAVLEQGVNTPEEWNDDFNRLNPGVSVMSNPGTRWPVRRMTLPDANGFATTATAETIFRLPDDLAIDVPEDDDRPGVQMWSVDNNGNLLARQYQGNYSWLATVVPKSQQALRGGLQPAENVRDAYYEVSVVVFYKRDVVPTAESERLIEAQFLNQRELVIFARTSNANQVVDAAVDEFKAGNWLAVMGVNQTNGQFLLKWYRILAMDDETGPIPEINQQGRYLMVDGPDWPNNSFGNLRAAILPGAIDVVTRPMQLQH